MTVIEIDTRFCGPPGSGNGGHVCGRLAAVIRDAVAAGERRIALGWRLGRDGRRHCAGTALFSESGACRAYARATRLEMPGRARP